MVGPHRFELFWYQSFMDPISAALDLLNPRLRHHHDLETTMFHRIASLLPALLLLLSAPLAADDPFEENDTYR